MQTYGDKMREAGWKNAYTEHPDHEGLFLVTTREGKKLKRKFEINKFGTPVWKDGNNDICWWKEIENE